jgi:hypothetical protein
VIIKSIVALLVLAACTDAPTIGPTTDSTCPATDRPTNASFGSAFFGTYCLPCHAIDRRGTDRHGAPPTIDFDTEALIRDNTSDIDKKAAFGATIHNAFMPPAHAQVFPTETERFRLGEYIACLVGR